MNKFILSAIFYFAICNIYSQDILETVTKEVCSCTKTKLEANNNPENLEMDLGLCIVSSYSSNKDKVALKYGNILENESSMEKLGAEIGLKMADVCPDVLMKIGLASKQFKDDDSKVSEQKTVDGDIVEIKTDQFVTIIIKDKNGRNQNCLLLNYFETASLFTNNELKKGSKVIITFEEKELYDTLSKDFRYFKVITKLEKK